MFIFSIFFLLSDNPPFGYLFIFLQTYVPLFKEALRFPFTKFSLIGILSFSILFSLGMYLIHDVLFRKNKTYYIFCFLVSLSIVVWMFPAFKGDLIYSKMRWPIPNTYFTLFKWFGQNDKGRVLNLPIYTQWGWPWYSWGYRGSGFLQYGIPNPLVDRSFDVWNPKNEGAYYEISYAIYSQDLPLLKKVLTKYDIRWLMLDKNIILPTATSSKLLFHAEILKMLSSDALFSKRFDEGNVLVYEFRGLSSLNSFFNPYTLALLLYCKLTL